MKGYLVLENGEVFEGEKIGCEKESICEVVFNTSMAGYIEGFTDPIYKGQGVCMTYPLIGNYGTISEEYKDKKIWIESLFVHELAGIESGGKADENLNNLLIKNQIPGLASVNTRKLTKVLRENGTMKGTITDNISNINNIIKKIKEYEVEQYIDGVSTAEKYKEGKGDLKIALIDYGSTQGIIKTLLKRNCEVTVFPSKSEDVIKEEFDGIVLSGGPGNPAECIEEIKIVKKLYESDTPILGIGLGHQLMGIATRCENRKIKTWA